MRLEENVGTVELTNPMYLHNADDHEDDHNPVFTLHDSVRWINMYVRFRIYFPQSDHKLNIILHDSIIRLTC